MDKGQEGISIVRFLARNVCEIPTSVEIRVNPWLPTIRTLVFGYGFARMKGVGVRDWTTDRNVHRTAFVLTKLQLPTPLPWHHRSTPSMAPGRSCADRPWIGVPSAFHSSTETMANRSRVSSRSGSVETFTQYSAAWLDLSLRSRGMRGGQADKLPSCDE